MAYVLKYYSIFLFFFAQVHMYNLNQIFGVYVRKVVGN